MNIQFDKINRLKGEFTPPADKSITHRALMMAAMARGRSIIRNPLDSLDTRATAVALGIQIDSNEVIIDSNEIKANGMIQCGNSGTTARLLAGLLAPNGATVTLDGDESLRKRPMARVIDPLRLMGANIDGEKLPFTINPAKMHPADIVGAVASAQVKSAILLAGVQLEGITSYTEPLLTRDHTERMLSQFGIDVKKCDNTIFVTGGKVNPFDFTVPGDISSAAMLIAAAFIFENSEILARNVGLNPTRCAFIEILRSWGADIHHDNADVGNLIAKSSTLTGGEISGNNAAYAIDELPMLATLGIFTEQGVVIRNAEELRHKECDRIAAVAHNLTALGADVEEFHDGLAVYPIKTVKKGAFLRSMGDHRIAMINILLAKRFQCTMAESDLKDVNISFPSFLKTLTSLKSQ